MENTFPLEIVTPERRFYSDDVCALTVETVGGRLSVLAGHIPMVTALSVGHLVIRTPGKRLLAFHSEGFMEVFHDKVFILAQVCEWPHEIDRARAETAAQRAEARLADETRSHRSRVRSNTALSRAKHRLKAHREADKNK